MNEHSEAVGVQVGTVDGAADPSAETESGTGRGEGRPSGRERGANGTSGTGPSSDRWAVFDILQNQRRRFVLYHLDGRAAPVELGALVEQVAAWENDTTVSSVTATQRKRVYDALQQVHLPRLQEAGLVEYDADTRTVSTTERVATLRGHLRGHSGRRRPWSRYYAALGVLYTVGAVLAWLLATPFVGLSAPPLAVFLGLSVTALACVNWYVDSRLPDDGPPLELGRTEEGW